MSNYPPHYAYPSAPPLVRVLPNPPKLHWGWVLALSIVTVGLFGMVWLFVQALWVKKATGKAKPFWWSLGYMLFIPCAFILGIGLGIVALITHTPVQNLTASLDILLRLAAFVLYVGAAFTLRAALEESPIDIPLGGVMTFFFSYIYFQYHLQDYDPATGVLGGEFTPGLGLAGGPVAPIISTESDVR